MTHHALSRPCASQHRRRPAASISSLCLAGLLAGAVACGPSNDPAATTNPGTSSSGPATSTTGETSTTDPSPTSSTTSGISGSTSETIGHTITTCSFLECSTGTTSTEIPGTCDVWAQDCPEGQKCAAIITDRWGAWNSVACVPVNGSGQRGDTCISKSVVEGLDDCARGLMCWNVDDMGVGTCLKLCEGTPDAPICPNDGFCTIANDGVLNLCFPPCSPLLQDCPEGNACYAINGSFMCGPDGGDVGVANDPCEFINVCEIGMMCADAAFVGAGCPEGSTSCCTPFCDLSDPAVKCPNPDQSCAPFYDPMNIPLNPPDAKDIGVCGLPG